jgi:hypothetical protein
VHYAGADVTAEALLRVLTGRHGAETPMAQRLPLPQPRGHAKGVSEYGADDGAPNLFVYLTGHGGDGFLKFHDKEEVTARAVGDALETLRQQGRIHRALAIFDTCQASTLGESFVTPGVLVMSSSGRGENSYASGSDPEIGQSLSDGFTRHVHAWAEERFGAARWDREAASGAPAPLGPLSAHPYFLLPFQRDTQTATDDSALLRLLRDPDFFSAPQQHAMEMQRGQDLTIARAVPAIQALCGARDEKDRGFDVPGQALEHSALCARLLESSAGGLYSFGDARFADPLVGAAESLIAHPRAQGRARTGAAIASARDLIGQVGRSRTSSIAIVRDDLLRHSTSVQSEGVGAPRQHPQDLLHRRRAARLSGTGHPAPQWTLSSDIIGDLFGWLGLDSAGSPVSAESQLHETSEGGHNLELLAAQRLVDFFGPATAETRKLL